MTKLSKLQAKIAGLREERGATDPILVIAAIAVSLVLLVGGSFAVAGIISNGHNLNAKSDLDKVSVAMVADYAQNDRFQAYDKKAAKGSTLRALEVGGVGFTPTEGGKLVVALGTTATYDWASVSESASNDRNIYVKTSESNSIVEVVRSTGAKVAGSSGAELADLVITPAQILTLIGTL